MKCGLILLSMDKMHLNYLRNLDPFDLVLVLSDINMPGMTGLELLRSNKDGLSDIKSNDGYCLWR